MNYKVGDLVVRNKTDIDGYLVDTFGIGKDEIEENIRIGVVSKVNKKDLEIIWLNLFPMSISYNKVNAWYFFHKIEVQE
jgi:hypothetical protein